jgi:hypothetical protein
LQEALRQRAMRAEARAVQVRANLEEEVRAQKARILEFQAAELKLLEQLTLTQMAPQFTLQETPKASATATSM